MPDRYRSNQRALSLGSCDQLSPNRALICANGRGTALSGAGTFTVAPRCSPPDLVYLWCARMTGTGLGTAHRETGGVAEDRAGPRSFPAAGALAAAHESLAVNSTCCTPDAFSGRVLAGVMTLAHPEC
jgi:hypothetical protein